MSDVSKLTEMVNGYDEQIQQLDDSITELTSVSNDLADQRAAIENVVMDSLKTDSDSYLTQKAIDLGIGDCGGTCSVCTSGGYGTTNLTDWAIVSGGCPPSTKINVFTSNSVSVSVDPDQYQRQLDFVEAYDHIHKEVDATGTYGIQGNKDNIDTGKSILQINKSKIQTVKALYEGFV